MVVLRLHAVVAELADAFGQTAVVRKNHSAVAEPAEILGREEAQARAVAEVADLHAAARGAYRLRAVLYDGYRAGGGDFADSLHLGALAVEVIFESTESGSIL